MTRHSDFTSTDAIANIQLKPIAPKDEAMIALRTEMLRALKSVFLVIPFEMHGNEAVTLEWNLYAQC